MLEHSQPSLSTSGKLMLSAVGSPAKTSPCLVPVTDSTANNRNSGMTSRECLAFYDRDSQSWKTRQRSLFEDWIKFSDAWPTSGSMRNGTVSPRRPLVHTTREIVSILSPGLPVLVRDCSVSEMQEPFIGAVVYDNDDQVDVETPDGFTDCFPREWIHPVATPQASDWRSGSGYTHGDKKQTPQLRHLIGGMLNPESCEWLLGFPIGYSELRR